MTWSKRDREFTDNRIDGLLKDRKNIDEGLTALHLTNIIWKSDKYQVVGYVVRRVGALRREQLEIIRLQSQKGKYKPTKLYAAVPLTREYKYESKEDVKFWRYMNACDEPYFSQVIDIYYGRARGSALVAETMEGTK